MKDFGGSSNHAFKYKVPNGKIEDAVFSKLLCLNYRYLFEIHESQTITLCAELLFIHLSWT